MKKTTDERLESIEDMIKLIHDHLMDLHRLAETALVAEMDAAAEQRDSMTLPRRPQPREVH
jgi:hypothetical protein